VQEVSLLLKYLQAPLGAVGLFAVCRAIGIWFEKEADEELRNVAREFLRSGSWLTGGIAALSASHTVFNKVYGDRYFSFLALMRCIMITFLTSAALWIWIDISGGIQGRVESSTPEIIAYIQRFSFSIPVDYLSAMRVRAILRGIKYSNRPTSFIFLSFFY
jgi:hypothetical protein